MKKHLSLHVRIFLGLAFGVLSGLAARLFMGETNELAWVVSNIAQPVGQIFLRLVFMAVVPLVVAALAVGVAEIGDVRRVGRIGIRTLVYTLLFSGCAVLIGIGAVNIVRPGDGIAVADRDAVFETLRSHGSTIAEAKAPASTSIVQSLVELIPKNPFASAADAFDGGLLPLMVFALILGIAMAALPEEKMRPLKGVLNSLFAATLKIIDWAMKLAPIGVAALVFTVAATVGIATLEMLAKYVLLVIACLAIHMFLVYGTAIRFIAKRGVVSFFRDISDVIVTAFATSSSNATLPVSLKAAKENLRLPTEISNFVLTIGASANQNGTALYEGVTVLFLAQFAGVELSLAHQFLVVFMCILAGIGTAGVPGGSLPFIMAVLQTIGVPPEGIGLIIGVDRILDMSRTVVNVVGDLAIATCVSAKENVQPLAAEICT